MVNASAPLPFRVDPLRGRGELSLIPCLASSPVFLEDDPIQLTRSLAEALFWVAVVACAVAQGALLRSAVRAAAAPAADPAHGAPSRRSEMAWAILPALVLALVLALTWRKLHEPAEQRHPAPAGASVISS